MATQLQLTNISNINIRTCQEVSEVFQGGLYVPEFEDDDLAPPSARYKRRVLYLLPLSVLIPEAGDSVGFQDFSNFLKIRRLHLPQSTIPYGTTSCHVSRHFVLQGC